MYAHKVFIVCVCVCNVIVRVRCCVLWMSCVLRCVCVFRVVLCVCVFGLSFEVYALLECFVWVVHIDCGCCVCSMRVVWLRLCVMLLLCVVF